MENGTQDIYETSAEYYDFVDAYTAREDVPFYVEQARASGGPVLEIGCGTGRVLIPTAKAGIEICGLDYSNAMLRRCREKMARESAEVRARVSSLTQGDMRDFELGRTFKLITIPFRPFQHLETVDDQLACLVCVRKHLADGGRFILDIFNPSIPAMADDSRLKAFGHEPEVAMPDGRRVSRWARIAERNYAKQYNDVELIYEVKHPDGRAEQAIFAFRMRYLFRYEAEHLLVRAGFEVEALYADYNKSPYGSAYPGDDLRGKKAVLNERRCEVSATKECAISLDEWLALTRDSDPRVRLRAVRDACPCHQKRNVPELWDRLIEMVMDEDPKVRTNVIHTLCDGSPRVREADVIAALERMLLDPNEKLRRQVRRLLMDYRRTGKINVL